jgi:quercetin dioxygenase-like cupin family protein
MPMANYSTANLLADVEDSAPKFGFAPALEARFAKHALDAKHLGVSYQRLAPSEKHPFAHRHGEQAEEIYVVVDGSGRVSLDDEQRDLNAWDVVHVAGPVVRSFEAGPDGLTLLAFGEIDRDDAEMITPDGDSSAG